MARVYLTLSAGPGGFNKLLVIKELRQELATDPEFVTMFLDEARLASRLNHPNVTQTYEVLTQRGQAALVMEYLEGQPLNALLARVGRQEMPLAVHVWILARVLAGLHYAHELPDFDGSALNIVHRDVSPQNVFLTYTGQVKLVDFGIAKASGTAAVTRTGVVKGKVGYIAPEQVMALPIDRRADIFAAGVMLWEALTRRRLAMGEEVAVMHARVTTGAPKVKDVQPDAPDALCAVCDKATSLDREDRYATAAEFQEALEEWLDSSARRVGERDLAALASAAFAEDRAKLRVKIEQRINASSSSQEEASLPSLSISVDGPNQQGDVSEQEETKEAPAADKSARSVPHAQGDHTLVSGRPGSSKMRWAVVVVGALAVGGAAAVLARPGEAPAPRPIEEAVAAPPAPLPAPSESAAESQSPAASATADNSSSIALTVEVTPADATVSLDGARLPTNPFQTRMPRDGLAHKLRSVAAGYVDDERIVVFDRDSTVEVALVPKRGVRPPQPPPRPAKPSQPVPSGSPLDVDLAKEKASRSQRAIDEKDPYPK